MMQHRALTGVAIGGPRGSTFDESERVLRLDRVGMASRMTKADSPWFALRCWTGRETAVDNGLSGLGIQALVPMRKGPDLRRRHRIIEGQMMPVIHGYVLVQVAPEPIFLDALKVVSDVIDVLGGCLNPKRLSGREVNTFKAMAEAGAYDWSRVTTVFKRGEKVRVSEGLFEGHHAEVVSCRSDGRGDAVVNVDVFGRATPTTLPLAMLEKL